MTRDILLREVTDDDLPIFFEHQLDPGANRMAAFTARDPADREAFMAHWERILGDETITIRTVVFDGTVAGNVVSYVESSRLEIGYWIGKAYWGQGVATGALATFLALVTTRPLYAGAAKDNLASLRVLGKCGFAIIGEGKGFSEARGEEVEEYLLVLGAPGA